MRLVFHIGNGKTATTYLQKHIEKIPGVLFLGKNINGHFIDDEFSAAHRKLFQSYPGELVSHYPNPSRNSYALASEYSQLICDAIDRKNLPSHVIISDECIGDYCNYLGELNTFLVILIGNLTSERISSEGISITKHISITCRNQAEAIKSFIGYSWTLSRAASVDKIALSMLSDSPHSYCGSLFYFERYMQIKAIATDWEARITPYELLEIESKHLDYISKTFFLEGCDMSAVNVNHLKQPVNMNSVQRGGCRQTILRDVGPFQKLSFMLGCQNIHAYKRYAAQNKKALMIYHGSFLALARFFSLFAKAEKSLSKIFPISPTKRVATMKESTVTKITAAFSKDNILLQKTLEAYDLKKYGYLKQ